jgi:hypothetical protein
MNSGRHSGVESCIPPECMNSWQKPSLSRHDRLANDRFELGGLIEPFRIASPERVKATSYNGSNIPQGGKGKGSEVATLKALDSNSKPISVFRGSEGMIYV